MGLIMSEVIGYIRVSSKEQTVENQKLELAKVYNIDRWFADEAVSGTVKAIQRDSMSKLLGYIRDGDTVVVTAIDRLGRDTIDVLETFEAIKEKGASLISQREGFNLSTPTGEAMMTIMAAMAKLERSNMLERQMAGIKRAKSEGVKFGRKHKVNPIEIAEWRSDNEASIKQTAEHFHISPATVKRACQS